MLLAIIILVTVFVSLIYAFFGYFYNNKTNYTYPLLGILDDLERITPGNIYDTSDVNKHRYIINDLCLTAA